MGYEVDNENEKPQSRERAFDECIELAQEMRDLRAEQQGLQERNHQIKMRMGAIEDRISFLKPLVLAHIIPEKIAPRPRFGRRGPGEHEKTALTFFREQHGGRIRLSELQKHMGISSGHAHGILVRLMKKNLINRIDKGVYALAIHHSEVNA